MKKSLKRLVVILILLGMVFPNNFVAGLACKYDHFNQTAYARTLVKPAAPAGLKVSVLSTTKVKLNWRKVHYATKYNIYRAKSKYGKYVRIAVVYNKNEYVNQKLVPATTYWYKVSAVNKTREGTLSSRISATTKKLLAAPASTVGKPEKIKATAWGTGKVLVDWEQDFGYGSGYLPSGCFYEVFRADSANGTYTKICDNCESTWYLDYNLAYGVYWYKVRARVNGVAGPFSDAVSFTYGITDFDQLLTAIEKGDQIFITDQKVEAAYEKAQTVISTVIQDSMTDYAKEKALHDYVVANTAYDYDNYLNGTISDDSYHPYGILVKGTGVCNGYSETMKLLLNMVGIECMVVTSDEMNHAWNIVKINGRYYQLDATWDDPVPDTAGEIRYNYFNLSDTMMGKDHVWDKQKYPVCSSMDENYFYQSGLVVRTGDELLAVIKNTLSAKRQAFTVLTENYAVNINDLTSAFEEAGYYGNFSYWIDDSFGTIEVSNLNY